MADITRNIVHWDEAEARRVIAPCIPLKGGLIEALHGLHHIFGYVPEESYHLLADAFNLSRAEVYGVKSFYEDFRSAPAGEHVIEVCQAESCQAQGSRVLTSYVENLFGIRLGETSADGRITLKAVYCLGNCAVSPSVTLDGRLYGRMSEDRLDKLLGKAGL